MIPINDTNWTLMCLNDGIILISNLLLQLFGRLHSRSIVENKGKHVFCYFDSYATAFSPDENRTLVDIVYYVCIL